jgi:hypothetical protein
MSVEKRGLECSRHAVGPSAKMFCEEFRYMLNELGINYDELYVFKDLFSSHCVPTARGRFYVNSFYRHSVPNGTI